MRRRDCVPCLEFKSADGAWYEVSLKLANDKLKIHFEGDLGEARDEEFSLENVKDLQELEAAFRLPSRQLIDEECEKVTPGMEVCASHTGMDRRTFDARVEKVTGSKVRHTVVDGEEQCNCTYEVLWLAGPYEGERTTIYCENIYLLQSNKIQRHPVIKDVVKYLEKRKDYKSQFSVESSSQTNTVKLGDNISRPVNSQVIILTENTERIMNRGSCWPGGARHIIDIEEELGELKLKPTNLKEMEGAEESFNYKLNMKSNVLQKLFSNDDEPGHLMQNMIYSIPGKSVLNGEDTDSNLCSPKQENRETIAVACKSEGDGSERDSLACIPFVAGDAKDGSLLKNFVDGFSGGWIDDESPRIGKNCGGNIEGNSDNDYSYFSGTGDANLVNRHIEFSEDWSARLGNCNKSSTLVIIEDESGDMQSTDIAIVCPSNMKVQKNWDVAKNEGVMNACTVFSEGRSIEPKFTNELANNGYIQSCGENTECEQSLDELKTPCLTPKKRKDLFSSDFYACKDVTCNKEKKSGMGVHVYISDSMGNPQGKRPRDDESNSVKDPIKGNISCEKEQGDVGKNSDALVEADNVIAENKLLESTPKSCCGHREDLPPKHASKHTATEDLPHVQCEYAYHSPSGLHDFSTDLLHNGDICHCHFCSKSCPCCIHFHLSHEYCAECGTYICGVVGKAHYYYSQVVVCTGCCSVCKELAARSLDCIGDGNDCLESLKDEFTDYNEQSKLSSHTGNLNLSTHQPLKSRKKLHFGGMAIVNNKAKCNILEQAVGQISMNVTCRPGREEELQDQHKLFASSRVILLENLDEDVNPSDVLSIIRQAGVDFVKVYVSPPQSFQKFTRGVVCFEDQESFQRVSAYLQNENIIVTSSKGRPWVVIDAENGLSEGSFGGFTTGPKCCGNSSNKVQILWRGTPEYESAKRLRRKFLEWWEDLKLLHQALAYQESAL